MFLDAWQSATQQVECQSSTGSKSKVRCSLQHSAITGPLQTVRIPASKKTTLWNPQSIGVIILIPLLLPLPLSSLPTAPSFWACPLAWTRRCGTQPGTCSCPCLSLPATLRSPRQWRGRSSGAGWTCRWWTPAQARSSCWWVLGAGLANQLLTGCSLSLECALGI